MVQATPPEVRRFASSPTELQPDQLQHQADAKGPKALTVHAGDAFPHADVFYPRAADPAALAERQCTPSTPEAERRPRRTLARSLTASSSRLTAASARAFHRMCSSCRLGVQRLMTLSNVQKQLQHDPLSDWTTKAGCAFGVKCYDGTVLTFHEACARGLARFPNAPPAPAAKRDHAWTVHGGNAYRGCVLNPKAQPA